MSRALTFLCAACVLPYTLVLADAAPPQELTVVEAEELAAAAVALPMAMQEAESSSALPSIMPAPAIAAPPKVVAPAKPFRAFTGKIKGKKVRMRLSADLDSQVIRELNKSDVLAIVGEKGDFYAVEAPEGLKAYVFRSFVLDNMVEGNRVNVRLSPDLDAPVIAHLNSGDRIDGAISTSSPKWYEISAPASTRFYVSKDFVENIGGPDYKQKLDKRRQTVQQLLEAASLLSKAELRKPFEEMDIERFKHSYSTIINDYADFPEYVEQAKEAQVSLQEAYMEKKIAFLEGRPASHPSLIMSEEFIEEKSYAASENHFLTGAGNDRMKLWEPVEEALYLSWAHMNDDKSMEEYYQQQKNNSVIVTGVVEFYNSPVKNKPGDFVLRDKDVPVAYLYSTQVGLQNLVGKRVNLVAAPRPNNNFAFPAYFILGVE